MKIVVFGLAVTSSWGNGHATLWRGLLRALHTLGHRVTFFERDVAYYAQHRDLTAIPGCDLRLYREWGDVARDAERALVGADVGMVTSYCPDALAATALVHDVALPTRAFYDLDTGVTLDRVARGEQVPYIGPAGLRGFDVVLSYTGGGALDALVRLLGARYVVPLYGSVDPDFHAPAPMTEAYRSDLSYLGTYAEDRAAVVHDLFFEPARREPRKRFMLGGAMYPATTPWQPNVAYEPHVAPQDHPSFYCSSRLTLNATRAAMATMGYCPSGRLFEAAACGVPILSDAWEGLDQFFAPRAEILVARTSEDALAALALPDAELARIARRARERCLDQHTAMVRARELVGYLEDCAGRSRVPAQEPPVSGIELTELAT